MTGAWSGHYDASTVDQNAIIDEQDGIYFATGFTGRGLMHSPAVGLAVSEMVAGAPLGFDLSAYKLNRASNREKYVVWFDQARGTIERQGLSHFFGLSNYAAPFVLMQLMRTHHDAA